MRIDAPTQSLARKRFDELVHFLFCAWLVQMEPLVNLLISVAFFGLLGFVFYFIKNSSPPPSASSTGLEPDPKSIESDLQQERILTVFKPIWQVVHMET